MIRPVVRSCARPIHARFSAAALRHNHQVARRHAASAKLWSVVKANAYGHGLMRSALALADVADGFALVELENAIALRAAGIRQPILMLEGFYSAGELPLFAEHGLIPVLHDSWQVDAFCAAPLRAPMAVYLKLNIGMNRLGLNGTELDSVLAKLVASGRTETVTLMAHFADADSEAGIARPMARFRALSAGRHLPVSLANSAALLRFPDARGQWARPGIMLYGGSPCPDLQCAAGYDLQAVMTLGSEIIAVREIASGDQVGYGSTFTADRAMRIGVAACGYADGYPRHAGTGTPILVDGRRSRTIGRVSMDKLCVDLSDIPSAGIGTPVTLWGEGLPADEVAAAASTISYELFCALAPRVPVTEV